MGPGRDEAVMKRVMLTVAYDGTRYHGWQIQPNKETIESVLNRCLSSLLGEKTEVIGASRTDAGVHALGNVAVFDTESRIPADKISYALNRSLPEDIRIQKSQEVAPDFHPRRCSSRKTYEYRIYCAPFPLPTKRLYAHFTYVPLDVALMRQAAAYLVGEHDFKSFCSVDSQAETTVRRIDSIQVIADGSPCGAAGVQSLNAGVQETAMGVQSLDAGMQETTADGCVQAGCMADGVDHIGQEIVIRVSGNGFLYNMVRIIAGTLMEAGRGHIPPERMQDILDARDRQASGPTAPACGLTLAGIEFEGV